MAKKSRLIATLVAWAFSALAWAATDAEVIAQGEALVRAGRYAEAYQLLEPLEDKLAGDLKFDYLLARAALETNRASRASFIYERILAADPNFVGVRLEMGRAYLALGDYARAKLEFETVLRFTNLPPDLREQATIYSKAAESYVAGKRTVGYGYVEYSFGYDSNPQSATSTSEIGLAGGNTIILPQSSLKRSDHFNSLALGGELLHALSGRFLAYAGADARLRGYRQTEAADFYTLDGRAGLGYNEGAHSARLGVTGGGYWLDYEKTRRSAGLAADYRYLFSRQDQFSFGATATGFRFVPESLKVNDYDLYLATIGWVHAVNDGRGALGLSLLGGEEKATRGRLDGDRPLYGGRLTIQHALTDRLGVFFLGGFQRGRYKDVNPTFDVRRDDKLYDVTTGLTWSFAKGWSLRPQVLYLKNRSNISLFEYDRKEISVNLRADS